MARPQEAKPVAVINNRSIVLPMISIRDGWPTPRPLLVAWEACSQTAPFKQTVEMMNAKAFRKLRFTEVVLVSPGELLLLPL
jgi:hypothetical protein